MATASVTNTFTAGTTAKAAEVNANFQDLVDFLNNSTVHRDGSKAMTAALDLGGFYPVNLGFTTFTPTLLATTTNPTLGTGAVQSGRYWRVGKFTVVQIHIQFGTSGAAAGTGTYQVRFETVGNASTAIGSAQPVGIGYLTDAGTASYVVMPRIVTATPDRVDLITSASPSVAVTDAAPFVWTNNDVIRLVLAFEGA